MVIIIDHPYFNDSAMNLIFIFAKRNSPWFCNLLHSIIMLISHTISSSLRRYFTIFMWFFQCSHSIRNLACLFGIFNQKKTCIFCDCSAIYVCNYSVNERGIIHVILVSALCIRAILYYCRYLPQLYKFQDSTKQNALANFLA